MNARSALLGLLEQTDQYVCFSGSTHTDQSEWI